MKKTIAKVTVSVIMGLLLTGSIGCSGTLNGIMRPQAKVTSGGGPSMQEAQQTAYNGPKARIAVSRFTDKTGKGWWTGQIGDGMSDMLTTSLFNTNRYIVIERQALQDVLGEQDLGASGRVKQDTAAPIGEIEGAELLITGAVTEFDPGASGIGAGFGGAGRVIGGIIGGIKKSHIAIDIRVIDTRTSRIVAATSVEGSATDISGLGGLAGGSLGGGLGGWHRQPIEKALRVAIGVGVDFIVSKTPTQYFHSSETASSQKSSSQSTYEAFPESRTMYVKGSKVNIRAGAGTQYSIVASAVKGDHLTSLGKLASWYHVKSSNGQEGYIYQNLITATKPPQTGTL